MIDTTTEYYNVSVFEGDSLKPFSDLEFHLSRTQTLPILSSLDPAVGCPYRKNIAIEQATIYHPNYSCGH